MSFNDLDKNSILDKITPCCALPFSVMYWFLENVTLLDNTDLNLRNYLVNSIQQNGVLKAEAWKVFAENVVLEPNAVITRSDLLIWLDGQKKPTCDQLRLIITESDFGNWTPPFNIPENIATVDMGVLVGNAYTKTQTDNIISNAVQTILGGVDPDTDTFKEVRDKLLELMQADAGLTPLSTFNNLVNNILPTYARKYPINFTNEERDAWMAFFNQSTTLSIPTLEKTISGYFLANQTQTYNFVLKGLNLSNLLLGAGLTEWKLYYPNGSAVPLSNYTINTFQVNGNESVTVSIQINTALQTAGDYTLKLYRDMQYLGQTKLKCWNGFSEFLINNSQVSKAYLQTHTLADELISVSNGIIQIPQKGTSNSGVIMYKKGASLNFALNGNFEVSFNILSECGSEFTSGFANSFVAGVELFGLANYTPYNIILGVKRGAFLDYTGNSQTQKSFINGGESTVIFTNQVNKPAGKVIIQKDGNTLNQIQYDDNNNIVANNMVIIDENADYKFGCYYSPHSSSSGSGIVSQLKIKQFN